MNEYSNTSKVSPVFWIISIIGLLWNLMGGYNFFAEYNYWTKPETRTALDPAFGPLYDATPGWLYVVFAIAVLTGILGCIGLLMRKKWAVTLFLVSLISVIIQVCYNLFATDLINALGMQHAVTMPIVIFAFALLLYLYSKRSMAQGWLS